MEANRPRVAYLDYVRAAALLCVILMHTDMDHLVPATGIGVALHQAVVVLLRIAIPCFFMASGALLLDREESFEKLLRHRVLRFVIVILLIQAVQYLYMFRSAPWKVYLQYYLQIVYSDQFAAHIWYLYSYLAFLLMLPLLRKLAAGMDEKHFRYAFIVYFVYMAAASFGDVVWGGAFVLNPEFSVSFFLAQNAVIYPLLGYYLHNRVQVGEGENARGAALLSWLGLLALAASVGMRILSKHVTGSWQFDPYSYIALPSAAFFLGTRRLCEKHVPGQKLGALFGFISRMSFGTYLLHNIYLDLFQGFKDAAAAVTGGFLACLLHGIAALVLGTAVSFVLKQIPGLKKLI